MNWLFFVLVAVARAQEYGDFVLKSQLTTYSNTLLQNTVFVLTPEGTDDTSLPALSTTVPAVVSAASTAPASTPIPTVVSASGSPATSASAPTSVLSPALNSATISESIPPPTTTSSSSALSAASFGPPTVTSATGSPIITTSTIIASTSNECPVREVVTERLTSSATATSHYLLTLTETTTRKIYMYSNGTVSSPRHTVYSTSTGTTTSTVTSTSACGCVLSTEVETEYETHTEFDTQTKTLWAFKTVDGLLLDPQETNELETYETTVNGSALLYIHAIPQTPVWPFEFNSFPERSPDSIPTTYPPPREIVPPQILSALPSASIAAPSETSLNYFGPSLVSPLPIYLPVHIREPIPSTTATSLLEKPTSIVARSPSTILAGQEEGLPEDQADFGITLPPLIIPSTILSLGTAATQELPPVTILPGATITFPGPPLSDPFSTSTVSLPLPTLTIPTLCSTTPIPTSSASSSAQSDTSEPTPPSISATSSVVSPVVPFSTTHLSSATQLVSSSSSAHVSTLHQSDPTVFPTSSLASSYSPTASSWASITSVDAPNSQLSTTPVISLSSLSLSDTFVVPTDSWTTSALPVILPTPASNSSALATLLSTAPLASVPSAASPSTSSEAPTLSLTGPVLPSEFSLTTVSIPSITWIPSVISLPNEPLSNSSSLQSTSPLASVPPSDQPTVTTPSVSTSSATPTSLASFSTTKTFEYNCGPLNSENNDVLVCKKNMQSKANPPSMKMLAAIHCATLLIFML